MQFRKMQDCTPRSLSEDSPGALAATTSWKRESAASTEVFFYVNVFAKKIGKAVGEAGQDCVAEQLGQRRCRTKPGPLLGCDICTCSQLLSRWPSAGSAGRPQRRHCIQSSRAKEARLRQRRLARLSKSAFCETSTGPLSFHNSCCLS